MHFRAVRAAFFSPPDPFQRFGSRMHAAAGIESDTDRIPPAAGPCPLNPSNNAEYAVMEASFGERRS